MHLHGFLPVGIAGHRIELELVEKGAKQLAAIGRRGARDGKHGFGQLLYQPCPRSNRICGMDLCQRVMHGGHLFLGVVLFAVQGTHNGPLAAQHDNLVDNYRVLAGLFIVFGSHRKIDSAGAGCSAIEFAIGPGFQSVCQLLVKESHVNRFPTGAAAALRLFDGGLQFDDKPPAVPRALRIPR